MSKSVVVAIGGNAILRHKEKGSVEEQLRNVRRTCLHLVELIKDGYKLVVTHGNGPQIGDILLKNEMSRELLPSMPLDICGAESQGMIGYMLQQSMRNALVDQGFEIPVVSLITQTIVNQEDSAFKNPTKPIGSFYSASEAEILNDERGWILIEDSGRGYRRVVPSPRPQKIVESNTVRMLFECGVVIIAAGGGGVPVFSKNGILTGATAVIDKDLTAQILANDLDADVLLMLTDVDMIALNYGMANQVDLEEMTIDEAKKYLREGHFAPGSMAPKVEAGIRFLEKGGERAIVTSLETARKALQSKAGTTIHKKA